MRSVLNKRDTDPMADLGRDHAVVRPTASAQHIAVGRAEPSEPWRRHIDYFWIVRWECPEPYEQQVIPQPCVHVSAEPVDGTPRLLINAISREPFIRTLVGSGHAFGAAFRPGGFRSVLCADLGSIAGRVVPFGDVVDSPDLSAAATILQPDASDVEMVAAFEAYLDGLEVVPDPDGDAINELISIAEQERTIVTAGQLAERAGVSLRTLQRMFTAYLGIGPKWVVQRFRLLDAAAAAHDGGRTDWGALAAELGFSDQAHLTRAFRAVVGTPPATYEREA
jgi:AraC-like DNA-binding protein